MNLEQVAAILSDHEFSVGQRVKVFPQNTAYEPRPGILGTVVAIYVRDDYGIQNISMLEASDVDNEEHGSVWYFGIDFTPGDPLLDESDDHGGYYIWELEAA